MSRFLAGRRAILAGGMSVAGCSVLPARPYQARRVWPLDIVRPAKLPPNPRGPVLLVRAVRAGPGLETRGLQTLLADGSVSTAYYEEWAVPPAQGIEASLRLWLAQAGRFAAVVAPGSRASADISLEAELTRFVAIPGQSHAVAAMSVVLFNEHGASPTPRMQQEFSATAPLAGPAAPEIVASSTRALTTLFTDIESAITNDL